MGRPPPPGGSPLILRGHRAPATLAALVVAAPILLVGLPPAEVRAGSLAYIGRSVFDVASSSLGPTLPLSVRLVHPSGARAYGVLPLPLGSQDPDRLGVLDTLTNTVVATVPVGVRVRGVAIHPSGDRLYVTGLAGPLGKGGGSLVVIDTATNAEAARIGLDSGVSAFPPIVLPSGATAYVFRTDDIAVVDTATNTVRGAIPLPGAQFAFARLHPSGRFLYAGVPDHVAVIDTRLDTVVRTLALPEGFQLAAIAPRGPDNARLFAFHPRLLGSALDGIVAVLDGSTGDVLAQLDLGSVGHVGNIVTDAAGTGGYVALYTCGTPACGSTKVPAGVAVIDADTLAVATVLPAAVDFARSGAAPIDPATGRLYLLGGEILSVVDTAARTVVASARFPQQALASPLTDTITFGPAPVEEPAAFSFYVLAATGAAATQQWGAPGDRPVPADYDGDGRADLAVWRPRQGALEGIWYVVRSADGGVVAQQWGAAAAGDQPVPADYDGDGRVDIAVWRPEQGVWYVLRSSDGQTASPAWGAPGDRPVPADYDGDGRVDLAVWRDGAWFIVSSRDGSTRGETLGEATDVPVPADYDGDGRADLAVWRPATGEWLIVGSRDGALMRRQWGVPGDLPVPTDYDGDGRADLAVWRAATGEWWIAGSRDGAVTHRQWGAPGDVPLPADFDGDGLPDLSVYRR